MYEKDFEGWNKEKQKVDMNHDGPPFFAERDVWWCAFGVNIGSEMDGKNENYERPVLILKYVNKSMVFVAPLTSKHSDNRYSVKVSADRRDSFVKIPQMRAMSCKRLLRKMGVVSADQFAEVKRSAFVFLS